LGRASISGWIYTNDNTRAGQRIFVDDVNNTGGFGFSLGDGGTGMLRFYSRSSNPVFFDTPALINNNTWYQVAAVADITGSIKRIYINGVQQASGNYTNAWGTDAGNASIGGETATPPAETGNRLDGRLDEIRMSSNVRSTNCSRLNIILKINLPLLLE
jgi:MSHA biogenesis protein MshQ